MDTFPEIELRHLRYFAVIAQCGTITEAARRLRIAQPSLSQQLISLERRLGTTLFDRTPHGMRLTASGHALLGSINRATDELRAGFARARDRPLRARIGLCRGATPTVLRRIVDIIDTGGPLEKIYETVDSQLQPDLLRNGRLDIGLVRCPVDDAGLSTYIVSEQSLGVVMASHSRLAGRHTLTWTDLTGTRLLWFSAARAPGFAATVTAQLRANGWSPPIVVADHGHTLFRHMLMADTDLVALRPAEEVTDSDDLVWRAVGPAAPIETLALSVRADTSWDRLLSMTLDAGR